MARASARIPAGPRTAEARSRVKPQDYSARTTYRRAAGWYRRLNWLGVPLTSMGLAPRDAVTLEVRGRSSGKLRKVPILHTRYEGQDYLVSLAGESQWVRNVRAAYGRRSSAAVGDITSTHRTRTGGPCRDHRRVSSRGPTAQRSRRQRRPGAGSTSASNPYRPSTTSEPSPTTTPCSTSTTSPPAGRHSTAGDAGPLEVQCRACGGQQCEFAGG